MYSSSDLKTLFIATLKIYGRSFLAASRATLLNWWVVFVFFLYALAVGLIGGLLVALLGGFVGSLVLWLIITLVVSSVLACVAVAVDKSKVRLDELYSRAIGIFSSAINVLFVIWLVSLASEFMLRGSGNYALLSSIVSLLIAILLNPLPEVIYFRGGTAMEIFYESFEFVRENLIEWFLPYLLLLLPVFFYSPGGFQQLLLVFAVNNPLSLIRFFVFGSSDIVSLASSAPVILLLLYCMYFALIFRGFLYQELATSTRRKRIYQERA